MEMISETFVGEVLMPDGVPFVIVFLEDWNRDTFNDMVDVLNARLSKWGSVFWYGLTTLFLDGTAALPHSKIRGTSMERLLALNLQRLVTMFCSSDWGCC